MEETLIKVTDVKGTVLKPIDATFKVEYKYEGEAAPEEVLVGDVKKGEVKGDDFPAPDAAKDLEYSEIVIDVKEKPGKLPYASKSIKFIGEVPPIGFPTGLPFIGKKPETKEEKQLAMQAKRENLLKKLQEIYPPKKS
ncbi:MAG: hypothetical protein GOVbin3205_67 [Prokaryotic dsDNA virus sp.]|jgi:hypothetical protein|nr:MAG: hypothetical protein GOVbin3205_67 [Prokaryotic dsDNA virus sp.]|tara:strand:+ start:2586 stop:2999 length:414 start_codon:yes stop_codon:yes gene_type:complete